MEQNKGSSAELSSAAAEDLADISPDPAVLQASDEVGPEQASEPWRKFYTAVRQAMERMRE